MEEITINGLTFVPYISREEIGKQVERVAAEIKRDCVTECPVFVSDLVRAIDMPNSEIAFIRYKSYSGTESTGQMNKILGLNDDITGREVIIVEDIVDTGLTARALRDDIEAMNPQSVKMATLLYKPASLKAGKAPEYVGFEIPPKFIIGYGLDLDEKVRGLRDIFVLKTED